MATSGSSRIWGKRFSRDYFHHQVINTDSIVRRRRHRNSRNDMAPLILSIFVLVVSIIIFGRDKPVNAEESQDNEQITHEASEVTVQDQTTIDEQKFDIPQTSDREDRFSVSGWTKVSDRWPQGAESYFVATRKGHHFVTTRLPQDVISRKGKIKVSIELYYSYKNIMPVLSFVSCSNKHDMRSDEDGMHEAQWFTYQRVIDTKECATRNDVSVDVLLHDQGDIFALKIISLEELIAEDDSETSRPSTQDITDNNIHINSQDQSGSTNQPAQQQVTLYKSHCEPKVCDRKAFNTNRFRPMINGLPKQDDSIMKGNEYFINDGQKPLKIKLMTKDNIAAHDICLDAAIYMDKGTELLLQYNHLVKETIDIHELVDTRAQKDADSTKPIESNEKNKEETKPVSDQSKSHQAGTDTKPTELPDQTKPVSPPTTLKTPSVVLKNVTTIITEITPEHGKEHPSWERRKICISDHLPRLDFGDESEKELVLVPQVVPNDIIGIQFDPKTGVSFKTQLPSRAFMPNLNSITQDNVQDFWLSNDGNIIVIDPPTRESVGTDDNSTDPASRSKQLRINDISSKQDTFYLVSRWLKLSDDQMKRVKFDLKTKSEDWIEGIDIGVQRAGANWSLTNVYKNDPENKKDEINPPIVLEDAGSDEFRVKIIYNLTEEARSSDSPHSLAIASLAIGDPCIDEAYCKNNGVCKAIGTGLAECECPQGYTGEKCENVNPCEVLYDGRSGKFICESIKAQCVEKIPVLRCVWPNDEYFHCNVKDGVSANVPNENTSASQEAKELSTEEMKIKIAEQSKLIIIMGALMAALSLFSIVIVGNLIMRLLSAKKRVRNAEDAREMTLRSVGDRRTPRYGRPSAASFQNQAFDD